MKYEQRDNSGSLFKNTEKQSDKHPDYSGTAMIDGQEFFMDAWLKTSDSGRKWMSFSFKPKTKQQKPSKAPAKAPADDDVPW